MRYNIFTEIDGVKNYVRRINPHPNRIAVTMYTTSKTKAFDFRTQENATKSLRLMGIGKAIETNE